MVLIFYSYIKSKNLFLIKDINVLAIRILILLNTNFYNEIFVQFYPFHFH